MIKKSAEANEKAMNKAIGRVTSGQLTYAVRDTEIDGIEIKKMIFSEWLEGKIVTVGKDIDDVLNRVVSQMVDEDTTVAEIRGETLKYVSRGGLKLEKAMQEFPITLEGKTTMDIGASTGGFTDCMLQNGAVKVFAVDVGYGQFAWKLRQTKSRKYGAYQYPLCDP